MSVWPYKTISSLGTVVTGSTPRTTEARFYGGDIPFVTPAELDGVDPVFSTPRTLSEEGANEARVLPEGTVMVCCIGSLGKVGIAGRPVATNQQINSVVFDTTRVWPRFGYYACRLLKPKLETMAPATTLAIVSKSKFESLKIPLPPLAEQRRIAVILDQVEVLRAKRRRALAQLDTLTQSLFLDIFGDPATNPKGWPSRPLGQLTTKFSDGPFGSNLKSSHYTETGVRVIRLQNIGVGEFIDEDRAYIAPEHFAGLAKHECLPGDVLIGTLGDPNLRACVQPTWLSLALNKADCIQVRPDLRVANAEYLCALLNQPSTEQLAQDLILGQTRLRISMGRLRGLLIPLPPLPLQREFAVQMSTVERLKAAQWVSLAKLDALFASLQHRAFRGEL